MLTGKFSGSSTFAADDHRNFNRQGQAFDRGETFSGLDYELGLKAVDVVRPLVPAGQTLAQFALRWILMFPAVTCAIPGAKSPRQVEENVSAAGLPGVSDKTMKKISEIYTRLLYPHVHHYW
jgi:aryl-alcohol dehydrogenase-like predicted oxidoreductase